MKHFITIALFLIITLSGYAQRQIEDFQDSLPVLTKTEVLSDIMFDKNAHILYAVYYSPVPADTKESYRKIERDFPENLKKYLASERITICVIVRSNGYDDNVLSEVKFRLRKKG